MNRFVEAHRIITDARFYRLDDHIAHDVLSNLFYGTAFQEVLPKVHAFYLRDGRRMKAMVTRTTMSAAIRASMEGGNKCERRDLFPPSGSGWRRV